MDCSAPWTPEGCHGDLTSHRDRACLLRDTP
jgi:hypothetical protein